MTREQYWLSVGFTGGFMAGMAVLAVLLWVLVHVW